MGSIQQGTSGVQSQFPERDWPSWLSVKLELCHNAWPMVGSNAHGQSVLCLACLDSAKILGLTIGLWGLVSLDNARHPGHFPLPTATVRIQRSEQLHRWDPCAPSCHSPRPSHCRAPTWAPGGQDQSRCNVSAAAARLPSQYPFLVGGVGTWGGNQHRSKRDALHHLACP